MDVKQMKQNKLKRILQFSIPSIIAMLLQTIITITDGFYTGNYVGEQALAAVNLGLPILYFYLGVGLCIGVGGSVISGRMIGAKQKEKSDKVFSQTIVTAAIVCVLISFLVFALFQPILGVLHADGSLSEYFTQYYKIMLFVYPLMVIGTILGMFIRVDGKPQVCMFISIAGCILNVILDYVFVAVMGLGVQGSAIGTLIVQIVSVLIQFGYFMRKSAQIKFHSFAFDWKINREILLNGSSEFIGEMSSAISMFAFNYVLMKYVGAEGVAAFTILGFVVYGYSMICIGFGQGISPLVSICRLVAGIFALTGKSYAGMFGCSNDVADMVSTGFTLYTVTFLVMGYDVINSMYFTSCGDAKSSALISGLRGIVLLLAFIFILPAILGMNGVWLAAPCTEGLTAIVSLCLIRAQQKTIKRGNENGKQGQYTDRHNNTACGY